MSLRLFAAVVPPPELQAQIAAEVERAGARVRVRWIPAANLHLTLAFLGDVADERLPEVTGAAQAAAVGASRCDLVLHGLGAFDSLQRARVLFLRAVAGEPQLAALAAAFVTALPADLRPQDRRKFSGHLTLARPRTPPTAGELAPLVRALERRTFEFTAQALTVFESRLGPQGATYHERSSSPLRA